MESGATLLEGLGQYQTGMDGGLVLNICRLKAAWSRREWVRSIPSE